ncbi:MAG: S1 RNA-binding domain-containing protein [Planctomycetaceae bacterium]|nr:S1 RNA-binding domain-containing protein [Planctomycetaceae bacterium]
MTLIDLGPIAQKLDLPVGGVDAVVRLLDEGNTVPFLTRYRRDQTGGLDEVDIRRIAEAVAKARQIADRKQTILRTIKGQGKLTEALEQRIEAAASTKQLEDLYLPFKPRKLSLAEIARQRRLEPLAREILAADPAAADLDKRAADFVDADGQVATFADALLGVGHIIADVFAERADVRQAMRAILSKQAHLASQRVETEGKALSKDEKHYRDYFQYSEHIQRIPPHRALAINRGERARLLKVRIEGPVDEMQAAAEGFLVDPAHPHADFLRGCARDSVTRLVLPSLEREIRREITEYCERHAVTVFARNLRNLLLQPPVSGKRVLALDPGFKSGCKAVVVDECGMPLEHAVLPIIGQKEKREASGARIVELVQKHGVNVIAVGNGTAGRETETLVAELVTGPLQETDIAYCVVNEAGASVYSTSAYAREELPNHEAAVRGAVSIGRRLQDPLSELVKIEPANIGVGLYQHDVKARHLNASLDAVVESCVNYVGVDANTASPALLRYVSGLNQTMAKGFQEWRAKNGAFTSRAQFLEVPGFGEAAHVQAAGFLKITSGSNPFDSTWIHPESYEVAAKVLERLGGTPEDLTNRQRAGALAEKAAALDLPSLAEELGVGRLLLSDIVDQLARPGRDPREDLPQPFFKKGVLKLEDLQVGMELYGAVLNVVDFGAFVDIGLHDSGMVHISQLSRKFVGDPHDFVSVGQIVKVWVLEIDKNRRRVALTMIQPGSPDPGGRGPRGRRGGQQAQAEGAAPAEGANSRPPRRRPEGAPQGQQAAGGPPPNGSGQRNGGRGGDQGRPPRQGQPSAGGPPSAGGRGQAEGGRPPRSLGGRRDQPRASQSEMGRVYESKKTGRDAAPITKAQIEGKEPLRTFGALKQLFTTLHDPPIVEPAAEAKPPEKAKRKPAPAAPETTVTGPTAPTGNAEMPPVQVPSVQIPPAADAPSEPDVGQGDLPDA